MAYHAGDDAQPDVVGRLVEYFSGSLSPAEDAAVESHLLLCATCRAEYDELGQIALTITLQPRSAIELLMAGPSPAGPTDPID
jgi:anti-sigma factor RsiW